MINTDSNGELLQILQYIVYFMLKKIHYVYPITIIDMVNMFGVIILQTSLK
jgi:hypothetical protein